MCGEKFSLYNYVDFIFYENICVVFGFVNNICERIGNYFENNLSEVIMVISLYGDWFFYFLFVLLEVDFM